MAADNNIFIRITGQSNMDGVNKELDASKKKISALEAQMASLGRKEAEDAEDIKKNVTELTRQSKALAENTRYYKEERKAVQDAMNAQQKSIETLERNAKAANALTNSGKSAMAQIRELRNVMMEMEDAGEENTKLYQELSIAAAKMSDQYGDLQDRIRILASDTRDLDAAMSLGSGITGTFNMATSAVELLGGESEGLEQAFYKVQAALSILNGVQEVANTLNKDSAFRVVAKAAADKIAENAAIKRAAGETILSTSTWKASAATTASTIKTVAQTAASKVATAAQWLWNAALTANPIGLVVAGVAALIAGIVALVKHQEKSAEAARDFAGALEKVNKAIADGEEATDYASRLAEAEGKSWKEVASIQEKGLVDQVNTAGKAYNKMLAQKKAANGKISDEEQQAMDDMKALYDEKHKELLKQRQDFHLKEVQEQTDKDNELLEAAKDAAAKRREEIKDAEEQVAEARIDAMEDGLEKELAQINLEYNRKIAAVKGNSEAEKELRVLLEGQKAKAIRETEQKYFSEEQQRTFEHYQKLAEEAKKKYEEDKERLQQQKELLQQELEEEDQYWEDRQSALEEYDLVSAQQKEADELAKLWVDYHNEGLLTEEEYQKAKKAIQDKYDKEEKEASEKAWKDKIEVATSALETLQEYADNVFSIVDDYIQIQIDKLDEMYTTDAEEAAKDSSKKLITEEEYEKKKAELTMKQAKFAKAQALTDIAIQTALAIMNAFATAPWPVNIAQAAIVGAMGVAQLAVAASKPLAQYATGRNGGEGEYALVGEKGPELMYVPKGASIVPNNKLNDQSAWAAYGVPAYNVPETPNADVSNAILMSRVMAGIDYDRLGQAVAENIPQQKTFSINVDRHGIIVSDGRSSHNYLNTKYCGSWH